MSHKPRLTPLQQWICDDCGEVIRSPAHGWVEWLGDSGTHKNGGFRVVHGRPYSPIKPSGHCDRYADRPVPGKLTLDIPLAEITGDATMPHLLMFVDVGPYLREHYTGPMVESLREWAEFARRLTIPYYEEARLYMNRAEADGFLEGMNEIMVYLPDTLKAIIEQYGD